MKQWREIKQDFLDALKNKLDEREAISQFNLLFEAHTGIYNPKVSDLDKEISAKKESEIATQITRLVAGEPIQHIIGYAWFDDMQLMVNSNVLIPRQETEELVYWIKNDWQAENPTQVLDIGTGSGAIALALANHLKTAQVTGIDISKEALEIAQNNLDRLELTNCAFEQMDILSEPKFNQTFDVIVSNPPYITEDFASQMEQTVTEHEPHLALFVPNEDPLLFYRTIAQFAKQYLQPKGSLYFEINEFFIEETLDMMKKQGYTAKAKKDLNGNWRMVKGFFD